MQHYGLFIITFSISLISRGNSEKICVEREIKGESIVCVCTPGHCDEIVREQVESGKYVMYSSSRDGLRFTKLIGTLTPEKDCQKCNSILTVDLEKKFQIVEGFGGAVTDAAAINWKNMSSALQHIFIETYFGDKGLQYNMIRVPIGGSEFSTHPYAYNELPENDFNLTGFSLSQEDHSYKIPMIKEIMAVSNNSVHVVASTWSPPSWMKSNQQFNGPSVLSEKFYKTYAIYHLKFLVRYLKLGVPIWAITTTNEPRRGLERDANFNSLGWTPKTLGTFVAEYLGPTIWGSVFRHVNILLGDDNRSQLPEYFTKILRDHPTLLKFVAGAAVHWYDDRKSPASELHEISKAFPDKFILLTEASEGTRAKAEEKVIVGSWSRGENYMQDIIENLNNDVVGWIDSNLCLNDKGGPNWAGNYADSPIIVYPETNEFVKQPMFYAIGHFSKFIPRDSVRIQLDVKGEGIYSVGFLTPNATVVVVLFNVSNNEKAVLVKLNKRQVKLKLDPHSFNTLEIPVQKNKNIIFNVE